MVDEPDNPALQILREIRGTLGEHSRVLAEHSRFHAEHKQAFAEIRSAMQDPSNNTAYAAGFSLLGRRVVDETAERVGRLETRVQRLEEKVDG